jgi:pseudaminic acid biosynthesis-associated methylase
LDTQEFWKGDFGNEYTERNVGLEENNYHMFNKIFNAKFKFDNHINSIIEYGSGSGMNIKALKRIFPDAEFTAVEINEKACEELDKIDNILIIEDSVINGDNGSYDLVISKGLLIHIHPNDINTVYNNIYKSSKKYILICEYYNPVEVEIPYRGNAGKLWKRDYIRPFLDYGCSLLDYGFISKYDDSPQDDLTWALFEKGKGINIHEEVSI